jgi:catechol 2,3-dioxygenase-like lactoylglutathione lyase family enzyme
VITAAYPVARAVGRMSLGSIAGMKVDDYDSLILYVGNLGQARAFYADTLGLPVRFEDEIIVVVGDLQGRSSCIGTTVATMSEGSFQREPRPGRHLFASTSRTPKHGMKRRDSLVCLSCGPPRWLLGAICGSC